MDIRLEIINKIKTMDKIKNDKEFYDILKLLHEIETKEINSEDDEYYMQEFFMKFPEETSILYTSWKVSTIVGDVGSARQLSYKENLLNILIKITGLKVVKKSQKDDIEIDISDSRVILNVLDEYEKL